MKKLLPLLLLTLAVIVSGCIGQTPTLTAISCSGAGVTNGIVISDFTFDFNEIYGDEAVGLTFTAENIGGASGELIGAEIFGPTINEGAGAGNLTWGCLPTCELEPDLTTENALESPNVEMDIPGGMFTETWTLEAPTGLGAEAGYNFNVRLRYSYETNFVGVLRVMSSEYLRSLPADERTALIQAGGLHQQCYSGGPIELTAASGTHFVDPESAPKTIRFKVTNVGAGFPYYGSDDIDEDYMYKVHLESASGLTCTGVDEIPLSRGQTGTFSCTFTATTPTNYQDITFTLRLDYNYWLDKSTFIKVMRPL